MKQGTEGIRAVSELLGAMASFFPAWKPTAEDMKAWCSKLLAIKDLDLGILRGTVEFFVDTKNGPYPPSFAEIRHEHDRRLEDRIKTQRKLATPAGNYDADAAKKAREFVRTITGLVRDVQKTEN